MSVEELRGRERWKPLSNHRHVAMAAVRQLTEASLPAVGRLFDHRDYTTVMHAIAQVHGDEGQRDRLAALVEYVGTGGRREPGAVAIEIAALRAEVAELREELARALVPERLRIGA